MKTKMNSRGVSAVVATVLIVLITITAGAILLQIVVPFVKTNLYKSTECFPYNDYFKFDNFEGSNCISIEGTTAGNAIIRVKAKALEREIDTSQKDGINQSLSGLEIIFYGDSVTKSFRVDSTSTDVTVPGTGGVRIPSPSGVQTYYAPDINTKYDKVEIYPVLSSGKLCDKNDEIKISVC